MKNLALHWKILIGMALGVVFGLARGYVIVLIAYMTAVVALDGESKLPDIVTESYSTPYMRQSVHSLSGVIPEDMRNRLLESVPLEDGTGDKELIESVNPSDLYLLGRIHPIEVSDESLI